jgi:folate-binding protein YgfZ
MSSADTTAADAEHRLLEQACAIVDRSARGKLALTGSNAIEFLNGQVTNELSSLRGGEGRYAAFLTHKGMMLGDLRVLLVDEPAQPPQVLLDTERVALQALFDIIRRFSVGYDVQLHKRTLESSLVSLIGPLSAAVAAQALNLAQDSLPSPEHSHLAADMNGSPVRLINTQEGFDVLCAAPDRDAVWQELTRGGAQVVSDEAVEVLRVERGLPRYGLDTDERTIPQEAGLNDRAVSFTKGCYVGQETVARLYYKGKPNRQLRGLRFSEPVRSGAELALAQRAVGRVGSSVLSPTFGPIGLGLVRREAPPGSVLTVGDHDARAEVLELPFER